MSTPVGNPFPTAKTARVCRTDGPICMALVPTSQGTQNPEAILTAAHMHPALSANVLFCRRVLGGQAPRAMRSVGPAVPSSHLPDRAVEGWQAIVRQSTDHLSRQRLQWLARPQPPPVILPVGHEAADAPQTPATG